MSGCAPPNITPQRKTFRIDYWEPKAWFLAAGGERDPRHRVSARYSGPTSPSGVTAPLYDAGMAPKPDYSGAAGENRPGADGAGHEPGKRSEKRSPCRRSDWHLPCNTAVSPEAVTEHCRISSRFRICMQRNRQARLASSTSGTTSPTVMPRSGSAVHSTSQSRPTVSGWPDQREEAKAMAASNASATLTMMLSCIPALRAKTSGVYCRGGRMRRLSSTRTRMAVTPLKKTGRWAWSHWRIISPSSPFPRETARWSL